MGNVPQIGIPISCAPREFLRQFYHGWMDAQNGVQWAWDYDRMNDTEQMAYEQGRLLVLEAMAEGFRICFWCGDRATCGQVDRLYNLVCMKLGRNISPPEWKAVV